ncbi:MAG: hypothetical protein LC797_01510 [Chloroflexi bacterium]|nr:hypothetical protein [Chloroflexota bacterium]
MNLRLSLWLLAELARDLGWADILLEQSGARMRRCAIDAQLRHCRRRRSGAQVLVWFPE